WHYLGQRTAQSLALCVRSGRGRSLYCRRRPEQLGGGRLHPCRNTRWAELRLASHGGAVLLQSTQQLRGPSTRTPGGSIRHQWWTLCHHRRLCLSWHTPASADRYVSLRRPVQWRNLWTGTSYARGLAEYAPPEQWSQHLHFWRGRPARIVYWQ